MVKYQQYNVIHSSRKWRNVTHCQDAVIYKALCHQYASFLTPYRCSVIPNQRACIMDTRRPRTELCVTPDNKNWTLYNIPWIDILGRVVRDRVDNFQILYLTYRSCFLTWRKLHYGQLFQTNHQAMSNYFPVFS